MASLASAQYAAPAAPASRVGGAFTAAPRTVDGSTLTVTQRVTLDRFVTDTETIYNSVPVTLTNVVLHTETLQTAAVSGGGWVGKRMMLSIMLIK